MTFIIDGLPGALYNIQESTKGGGRCMVQEIIIDGIIILHIKPFKGLQRTIPTLLYDAIRRLRS